MVDSILQTRRARGAGEIRIYSQNLFGRRADWPGRRPLITAWLSEHKPDLVAFQEAVVNDDHDQVADLLGPEYHVAHQAAREIGRGREMSKWHRGFRSPAAGRWETCMSWTCT